MVISSENVPNNSDRLELLESHAFDSLNCQQHCTIFVFLCFTAVINTYRSDVQMYVVVGEMIFDLL